MEDIGSKPDEDEAGNKEEQTPADVLGDDVVDEKDVKVENSQQSVLAVKRKLNDGGNDSNEPLKRPRKWKSDGVRVPEPQGSNLSAASTPQDALQTPTSGHGRFSRSDFAPKEPVVLPPPDKHPTNSLRIDRFVRPFRLRAVQKLLGKTGTVKSFWMDHLMTHCYVTYSSVEEAVETRNAVNYLQWPPKVGRALVAVFVEPEEVKSRLEAPPRAQAQAPAAAQSAHPPEQQLPPPPPFVPEKADPTIVAQEDAAAELSVLFRKTKAAPGIYYLPLSEEQVAAKLSVRGKAPRQQ